MAALISIVSCPLNIIYAAVTYKTVNKTLENIIK